ncbi:MAG TPA: PEP-CTERM sorting domain-containing protein [Fimbriimonadaceae bacterium]|nr:PEP-CTERM sorting domain-containing protein [Fimbriimonadaceae bacterium]
MKKLGLLAFAAVTGSAYGFNFDLSGGTGGAIPDGAGANTAGATLTITLNVSGNAGATIASLDLAGILGLSHTWMGDLVATLEHEGVVIDLMDRNYRTTTGGSGGNLILNGDYMFNEGGPNMTGATVPSGTYGRHANAGFGSSAATGTYADLVGKPLDGDWILRITDHWTADTGNAGGLRIVGSANPPVPEPATLTVLGLGAFAALRRRRK